MNDVITITSPTARVVEVLTEPRPVIQVVESTGPPGPAGPAGPPGPQGPEGKWVQMTQAQYDALNPKDPNILYVIVG